MSDFACLGNSYFIRIRLGSWICYVLQSISQFISVLTDKIEINLCSSVRKMSGMFGQWLTKHQLPSALFYKGRDHTEIQQFLQLHHYTPESYSFWNATLTASTSLPGFPRQPVLIRPDLIKVFGLRATVFSSAPVTSYTDASRSEFVDDWLANVLLVSWLERARRGAALRRGLSSDFTGAQCRARDAAAPACCLKSAKF